MKRIVNLVLIAALLHLYYGCNNKDKLAKGELILGKKTELKSQTLSTGGGQVTIDKPGDPLDKLNITIPANAYSEEREFSISSQEIKESRNFGPQFHAITPLISISNGGGYSDELMELTIPVKVPEGQFAMAFVYDENTGELEAMPLVESNNDKVVVVTMTFDYSNDQRSLSNTDLIHTGELSLGGGSGNGSGSAKIVVTATEEKALLYDYDTGFRPGVDDCPMPNPGSMYSPKGICSGESVAALWYYNEKKLNGAPPLFNLLDNDNGKRTPDFWQDDVKGTKLASLLQYDYSISLPFRFMSRLGQFLGQAVLPNRITMHALCYAMIETHKPQIVGVVNNSLQGHAMIVYRIRDHELYIADPNLPGVTDRRIKYNPDTHDFENYTTGLMGNGQFSPRETYNHLWFLAKGSLINYPSAGDRWKELEAGTVGDSKFPKFELFAMNSDVEYVPLTEGFQVPDGKLNINVHFSGGFKGNYLLFDDKGNQLTHGVETETELSEGEHQIGVCVTDEVGNWAGFKWVTVVAGKTTEKQTGPVEGDPRFIYRVDGGQSIAVDTGYFKIDKDNLHLGCPKFYDGVHSNFSITLYNFNGPGTYNDAGIDFNDVEHDFKQFGTINGTVIVTKWGGGRIDGTFKFLMKDVDLKLPDRTLEGEFHYPR